MPAPKTSVGKKARTTQPQFLLTWHVRHTGSTIMTVAVGAFIGTVFFTGFFWANIFVAPALAIRAPEFLDQGGRFPGFHLSLIIYAVGWLLFGLASLKTRAYPR